MVVAVASAFAFRSWRSRRLPISVDLDRGLADCPWPKGVDQLNPDGFVRVEDRDVTLRAGDRVYFTGRVSALDCFGVHAFSPAIQLELSLDSAPPDLDAGPPPPPLDPGVDRTHDDLPAALAAYRWARRIVDGFTLGPEDAKRARESLDRWYAGDHSMNGGAGVGEVGRLASGGVEVQLDRGADVLLTFAFATDPSQAAPGERVRICVPPRGNAGMPGTQAPQGRASQGRVSRGSDAALARLPFARCPQTAEP